MNISVIHPSRGRAEQAYQTYLKWTANCDNISNIEYILSLDKSDEHVGVDYANIWQKRDVVGRAIIRDNHSAIEAINEAAKEAKGNLIIVISDDFSCAPHWDTLLLQELAGKSDFVLKTKDGIQKTLVTLPIMDRIYYERFGYIYRPAYLHMGADVELTAVAIMTGKLLYSDLVFPHLHYSKGLTPKDAINVKNDLTYEHGDQVLARHKANNFGITNPLITYEQIQWH